MILGLLFEAKLLAADTRLFVFEATHLWTLEIIADTQSAVTIYQPIIGHPLGTNTQWLVLPPAFIVGAAQKIKEERIVTPAGRELRAYGTGDATLRGYGVRA